MNIIQQKYDIKPDWSGKNLLGYELEWNYEQGWVRLSMPDYVIKALRRLNYIPSQNPRYSPYKSPEFKPLKKGERQIPITTDDSPFLDPKGTRWVQSAIGSYLYYARALDNTILATLNQLGTQQALPTENTKKAVKHLLDYVYTYRQSYLQFNASDMILHVDSDAAYLVLPKARSRIAGFFRLRNKQNNTHKQENGAILVECKAIRWVVTSAAEAETHGVFYNAK